mmetsp:Transcript_84198/g.234836  ORF Transcript_84198/g.234836 Transcript_84198/m.234836 type:complete len:207 (+) Transcript_84198:1018-1638(+)
MVLAGPDGLDLSLLRPEEWHVAEEHHEDGDAQAPKVTPRGVTMVQDLGCNVRQGATTHLHFRVFFPNLAEAEIDELQVVAVFAVVKEILKFDVAVHHVVVVDVAHGQEHLPCGHRGVALRESTLLTHAFEEFPSGRALHDKVEVFLGLVHVDEAYDVRMVQGQEDLCLVFQLLFFASADAVQLEGLHGIFAAIHLALGHSHLSIVA